VPGSPPLLTAEEAALYVRTWLGRPCTASTVRGWAHDHPDRFGDYPKRGRARQYSAFEIHEFVTGETLTAAT
jgi:hypothetical protein